jgi:hypothetical protein
VRFSCKIFIPEALGLAPEAKLLKTQEPSCKFLKRKEITDIEGAETGPREDDDAVLAFP